MLLLFINAKFIHIYLLNCRKRLSCDLFSVESEHQALSAEHARFVDLFYPSEAQACLVNTSNKMD